MNRRDLTIERAHPSGAWVVSGIVPGGPWGDYRASLTFYGYTKAEAAAAFLREHGETANDDESV